MRHSNNRATHVITIGDRPLQNSAPEYGDEFFDALWERTEHGDPTAVMNEVLQCLHRLWFSKPFQNDPWVELVDVGNDVFNRVPQHLQTALLRWVCNKKRRGDLFQVCETRMNFFRVLAQKDPRRALKLMERERTTLPFKGVYAPNPNLRTMREYYSPDADESLVEQTYLLNLDIEILIVRRRLEMVWGLHVETGRSTNGHAPSPNGTVHKN